jgi:alpha-glucosidase
VTDIDIVTTPAQGEAWWRSAVIYQIYPRSFADSNGDGIGDLNGVRSRLRYLANLGVDAIWLSPFYPSPQADGGYDVADYRDVDPIFGTLDDARALIGEAHQHGLRIIIDLVPNHTSDQHPWFRAALAAGPGSPERARYLFRDGRGVDGSQPPNNWTSNFGGPAWTRVPDGQWYLHLFAREQPDLDWTNPEVIAEFESILRFWLDAGVDGFRIDVAHGLAKDPDLTDLAEGVSGEMLTMNHTNDHPHWDRDEVHEVYRGWRRVIDGYGKDRVFCAEAWVPNPDRLAQYLRSDELQTAFNFNFLAADWDPTQVRLVIEQTLQQLADVDAPATWVLSNHDVIRHPTRLGGDDLGRRRAKAATLLMLALPGGAYLYQGEELGLPEVLDIPDHARQDPIFFRSGGQRVGRDGCRVPLPWSGNRPPFGFSRADAQPWLPQPADWAEHTEERQDADPDSTLSFYRRALRARRFNPNFHTAALDWIDAPDGMLAFHRGPSLACVLNYTDEPMELPTAVKGAELLLASGESSNGTLAGSAAAWFTVTDS